MVTNLDLYEALKAKLGEKAARMVADVVPAAGDLATRADLSQEIAAVRDDLSREIAAVRDDLREESKSVRADIGRLEVKLAQMETRLLRWTLTFFVPLWVSMLATMWALLLRA